MGRCMEGQAFVSAVTLLHMVTVQEAKLRLQRRTSAGNLVGDSAICVREIPAVAVASIEVLKIVKVWFDSA